MKLLNRLRKMNERKGNQMPEFNGIAYTKDQLEQAIMNATEKDAWFSICIYQEQYREITGAYFKIPYNKES